MNCIIIDDEPIARRGMKKLVEKDARLNLAGVFGSAEEAMDWLSENTTDLIFLDIQMPGMTGIEFARQLPEKTMIIFTTAYSEYAVESYAVDAVDYLVKPINPDRFEKAVTKAAEYISLLDRANVEEEEEVRPTAEYLIVKADRRFHRISYKDILYVEGLKDYVIIHLPDRNIITRMMVKQVEEALPSSQFMRVNKSYIVNIAAVESFDSNDIFIGNAEIAISPLYRESVTSRLMQ